MIEIETFTLNILFSACKSTVCSTILIMLHVQCGLDNMVLDH